MLACFLFLIMNVHHESVLIISLGVTVVCSYYGRSINILTVQYICKCLLFGHADVVVVL